MKELNVRMIKQTFFAIIPSIDAPINVITFKFNLSMLLDEDTNCISSTDYVLEPIFYFLN